MRKIICALAILLLPCVAQPGPMKGYDIFRIYQSSKATIVDVTYWEWEEKTLSTPYSALVEKAVLKKALAKDPAFKISATALASVTDNKIADTTEIKIEGVSTYVSHVKKAIIGKETVTWQGKVEEVEIREALNERLLDYLPEASVIPEQRIGVAK